MVTEALNAVDWWSPAFAPYARVRPPAEGSWRDSLTRVATERRVLNSSGLPIQFSPPDSLSDDPYEAHIAATGRVPTRDNRHDLFNALAWLVFPRTKSRLNALQAGVIARDGIRPQRGTLRDAATVFDENGVLLVSLRQDLIESLSRRDWRALFVDARSAWPSEARAIVFGHALLDKLVSPYKALTAHAIHVPMAADTSIDALDAWLCRKLDDGFSSRGLLPIPVLGIPGWSTDNEDSSFYDDSSVFRPATAGARF